MPKSKGGSNHGGGHHRLLRYLSTKQKHHKV